MPVKLHGRGSKKEKGARKSEPIRQDTNGYQADETLTDQELMWMHMDALSRKLEDNKRALEERVGLSTSFDVLFREMTFGGKRTGLLYLNGFAKDEVLTLVLTRLSQASPEELSPDALTALFEKWVPHIQVEKVDTISDAVKKALIGASVLFVDNETEALAIDAKTYPLRSIEEPSTEKVVRGSRDGFVESLLMNVTLVRRRLRDPRLKFELFSVGKRSKTDVCVAYINDVADLDLVREIKKKIEDVQIDGLPLGDKQLEELIIGKTWNPYPQVRYSERPDVIAVHLLEGHIVVMVDNSPSAMIFPSTFFHLVQHAEEYRQTPVMGTYLRWVRFFGIAASVVLLPLWFLFVLEPQLLPERLDFIGPQKTGNLPILVQFLLVEIGVDLMRLAAVHTPTPLATAMGLIAAILIGDIAVKTGLFVNEVILYMAVAAVGMFATPSYELGLANRLVRLLLLGAVALFKIPGLVVGLTLTIVLLVLQRAYHSPYMWPFIPFDARAFFTILVRNPSGTIRRRPSLLKTYDNTRQPR
jgi:stage V sporulation protein AF